ASRRARSSRAPSPTTPRCGRADRAAAPAPAAARRRHAVHRCRRNEPGFASRLPAAAEHRLETSGQRARAEWLGEKVVGTKLEDAHLVVLVALRGQHDHRNVRCGGARAQARQYTATIDAGATDVD